MAKSDKFLNLASRLVSDSIKKKQTIAIIEKGGNILSFGINNMVKSHSCYFNGDFDKAIHAEYSAINKATDPKGSNMYIFRFLKIGGLGISKPCKHCMDLIVKNKIRTITYFDGNTLVTEKPKELEDE